MPFPPFERIHPDIEYSELVLVPGGTFMMGSDDAEAYDLEKPVTLPSFAIGKYPVTQALWTSIMGDNPACFQGANRPVEQVSWEDAQHFLQKLNAVDTRLQPSQHFRMPSEVEWEYAALGGQQSGGYRYAGSNVVDEVGWYDRNSHGQTQPVGLKLPNELGICDMNGNVWEWCAGHWHDNYIRALTYSSAWVDLEEGAYRVLRGGSWDNDAQYCRPSNRITIDPSLQYAYFGFRLVLFPLPISWPV
jgi:formylglycine-generating enzyme required for sulfatase activity